VKPRDPDFPFDLEYLLLQIVLPEGYPETENLKIEVLNDNVPETLKAYDSLVYNYKLIK
jgi:hypothetical protein